VGRTREKAAVQHGVPEGKVRAALELDKQSPALAAKVLAGEMTLNQARLKLKTADAAKGGTTAAKRRGQRPTADVGNGCVNGAASTPGVKPQEPATEQGGPEPSVEDSGVDSPSPVDVDTWIRCLLFDIHGVDPAELAAELVWRLGAEQAAKLRDALTELLTGAAG
jgi:hypothetical protein